MSGLERIATKGGSLPQGWVGMEWVLPIPVYARITRPTV
jgi:hypothetical protein